MCVCLDFVAGCRSHYNLSSHPLAYTPPTHTAPMLPPSSLGNLPPPPFGFPPPFHGAPPTGDHNLAAAMATMFGVRPPDGSGLPNLPPPQHGFPPMPPSGMGMGMGGTPDGMHPPFPGTLHVIILITFLCLLRFLRLILKMSLALLVNRMNQLSLQCRACIDYHCLFLWLQACRFHRQGIMVQCHLMRGAYPPCPLTCYTVSVLSYNERSTQQKLCLGNYLM